MNGYEAVKASRWFSLDEFSNPEDLVHLRSDFIQELDTLREFYGFPIHPSRHPDGIVRKTGSETSRHFAGDGRLTDAMDVFPEGRVGAFLVAALMSMSFRGIGVYGDTKIILPYQPGPMVHLDRRPGPITFWVRQEGEYIYRERDPQRFYRELGKILDY